MFYRTLFLFWTNKCKSPCLSGHKLYFMNHFHFTHQTVDTFKCKYSIYNFLDNDYDAILYTYTIFMTRINNHPEFIYCSGNIYKNHM